MRGESKRVGHEGEALGSDHQLFCGLKLDEYIEKRYKKIWVEKEHLDNHILATIK